MVREKHGINISLVPLLKLYRKILNPGKIKYNCQRTGNFQSGKGSIMAKNMDIDNNSFTIRDIMDVTPSQRIAMLIDGDNAQPSMIEKMLAETTKYGLITIRRIYGDWTASNMGGWKDVLQTHAIQPIQQFRYTVGKNATDSAMIIDAMDLFYSGSVDGFCLVSSDSDYTRLATRIRENGIFVMGIGKKQTPRAFVNACDLFVYTENLGPAEPAKPETSKSPEKKKRTLPPWISSVWSRMRSGRTPRTRKRQFRRS